jgi:hypothetical protein
VVQRISLRYILALALICAAGAGYLLSQTGTAKSASPNHQAAEQAAISHLSVFERAAQPSDTIPASEATIAGTTRRIGDSSTGPGVWASVNTEQLCVQLANGASACVSPEEFTASKPLIVGSSSNGGNEEAAGLVPDGITSVTANYQDGTSETVSVTENGFYIQAKDAVKNFSWTTSNGTVHQGQTVTPASGSTADATEER